MSFNRFFNKGLFLTAALGLVTSFANAQNLVSDAYSTLTLHTDTSAPRVTVDKTRLKQFSEVTETTKHDHRIMHLQLRNLNPKWAEPYVEILKREFDEYVGVTEVKKLRFNLLESATTYSTSKDFCLRYKNPDATTELARDAYLVSDTLTTSTQVDSYKINTALKTSTKVKSCTTTVLNCNTRCGTYKRYCAGKSQMTTTTCIDGNGKQISIDTVVGSPLEIAFPSSTSSTSSSGYTPTY